MKSINILNNNIKRLSYVGVSFLLLVICSLLVIIVPKIANATDPIVGFNPGRIIEDSVFTNASSMDVSAIQDFLNFKVQSCDTNGTQPAIDFGRPDLTHAQYATTRGWSAPPYPCLKDYTENNISAAQLIYNVSQTYRINPQVLIVLLQKEQGLVTDTWPLPIQYRSATGYGCPDTAPCDSEYYGLTNQLVWSGRMFRSILNNSPTWYSPYILGDNFIQWNPDLSCGGTIVNIQNRSTQALYDYTPYQPNQSALNSGYGIGDSCGAYGNRNFYLYFRDWFGYNSGPAAFKVEGSSTIYIPIEGYKLAIPHTAVMQDYGISVEAIQIVSQAYVDAIPEPSVASGISSYIGHVVKSPQDNDEDGGSVYLISRGKRYQFKDMQQIYDFGYTEPNISYLPLSYIYSKPDGGILSNFITSPYSNVFKVTAQSKQIIFEYGTYMNQNPTDKTTPLSYYLIDRIPSGNPITDRPVLIKNKESQSVRLYQNDNYYSIADYNIFSCWGFDKSTTMPVYRLSQDNYIATITDTSPLSCIVNDGQDNIILNGTSKSIIPSSYGITGANLNINTKVLSDRLPTKSTPLKSYIKSPSSAAVWYIVAGKRRLIPSYSSFLLLGLNDSSVDIVSDNVIDLIPIDGIKLADGQLVKTSSSAAVYIIANDKRVLYSSSNSFIAYNNSWNNIETYSATSLDQYYPDTGVVVGDYLVDTLKSKAYIIGQNGCFELSNSTLLALDTDYATLSVAQPYSSNIFKNINLNCLISTNFIKLHDQSLVYWIDSGEKHALNTYASMLNKNDGKEPLVMEVTSDFISAIGTGTPYN